MTGLPRSEGFRLDDRVILITGAAGILGQEYSRTAALAGAHVIVADIDQGAALEVASGLEGGLDHHLAMALDVTSPGSVTAGVSDAMRRFGRIDVLLNNAAGKGDDLAEFFAPTVSYSVELWRRIMSINIEGQFLMAREVGQHMLNARSGSIINVSSIYGCVGPDQRIYEGAQYMGVQINTPAVYSISKAAVHGLTRHLATEWGAAGIRVNTLTPGGVQSGQNDAFVSRYSARTPLGRMAQADEMTGAMLFLASDASTYVSGQNIIVDGGWTAW